MDRRSFVVGSAVLGATALTGCGSTTSKTMSTAPAMTTKTMRGMGLTKKSLKWGMIKEEGLSVMEKFQLVKDLGFDGIELDWPNNLDEGEILAARDKTGLELPGVVNSLHWKNPISSADPAIRATTTDSMMVAMDKTKLYGGTTVLLVAGTVNDKTRYDEAWHRSTAEIKKMIPHAEKTGIKIAIENVWNNFLLSPMEAANFVDQFNSPMVGWYFDVGNVVRYGWPDQWVRILGDRIMKVDIKDYSRKKQTDEGIWEGFKVLLGDGHADYAKVNEALKDIGYSGWGSAEVRGGDKTRLAEVSERMDMLYSM